MRWRRSWRRFADPLFIIIFEDAHYSPRRTNLSLSQGRHAVFHRARLQVLPFIPGEAASVRCFDVVLGKVHLLSWRFIVVRHGSHAHRGVYCFLPFRRFAADIFPFLQARFFQGIVGPNPNCVQSGPLRHVSFSLGFSSTGVAPLPPCSRKLLDETVKTSVCMLSVPLKHERPSQQQLAKCRNLPFGVHRCFHVAVPRILVFFKGLLFSFLMLSSPRVVFFVFLVFSV